MCTYEMNDSLSFLHPTQRSEVQIATVLLDQELDFIENTIVNSREYTALSFLDEYLDHLKVK